MEVFLAILMMMTTGSVAIFMLVRYFKSQYQSDERTMVVVSHLVAATLVVLSDLIWGGESLVFRLPFDMLLSLFPMQIIASSVWEEKVATKISQCLSVFIWIFILAYFLRGMGVLPGIHYQLCISLSGFLSIIICALFLLALILRIREIRLIMKHGNVWSSISLTMDVIYLIITLIYSIALLVAARISTPHTVVVAWTISLLMAFEIAALGLRVSMSSLFIIRRKHERTIVESMRISQTDVSHDTSKINDMYKNLYTRVVTLFENEKPYLNSELTINDIVKVTFTNKLYISKAISQFTGRNFCQFVNYYRVLHSIQIFRENPDLKVIEMATQSGFNSSVSFSMAFRLYMGESPSDWCRKEKLKLKRRKK